MKTISVTFEQVASALEAHAAKGQVITYNDFADEVGLPRPNNLFLDRPMKDFFEQIDWNDPEEHRSFRTALVVHSRVASFTRMKKLALYSKRDSRTRRFRNRMRK